MKGAVTINTTSPRCNFVSSARNIRSVNSISAAARWISAAFPGIRFLISTTAGCVEEPGEAEPGDPESTRTGACCARWSDIATMIAAVVLWSGG